MQKSLCALGMLLCCVAPARSATGDVVWTATQLDQLRTLIAESAEEGLNACANRVVSAEDATVIALKLADAHLNGCWPLEARAGWRIESADGRINLTSELASALSKNDLPGLFARLRPRHSDYPVLRAALRVETDPKRRLTLLRNLERWRWMPLDLGSRYLLVNAPRFEVGLWENGRKTGTWRIIVGKQSTPTPVFSATVTGVTYNPWWDVPASIVTESVGRLTRRNPREARRRGFVWGNGSYRQRPGPNNPLGQMKLVMPNPYSVYLHDTNAKALFDKPVRAFSHGCIRVENALGLAAILLGKDRHAEAGGQTISFPITQSIPVYIAYFTASVGASGQIEFQPDIYGRDARMGDARNPAKDCPA